MSFEFSLEDDGTLSLESAVFQALGAASACWENLSGAGVFQSEEAQEIGNVLVEAIKSGALELDLYEEDYDAFDEYPPGYCEQCNDYHDYDDYDAIYDDGVDDED